jgi:hypothetical protein
MKKLFIKRIPPNSQDLGAQTLLRKLFDLCEGNPRIEDCYFAGWAGPMGAPSVFTVLAVMLVLDVAAKVATPKRSCDIRHVELIYLLISVVNWGL